MRLVSRLALLCLAAASVCARADVLSQATDGPFVNYAPYIGQSFTAAGTGSYTHITFNFYTPGGTAFAAGTGYLFSAPYTGTPSGLNALDPNLLGTAAASGGTYDFGSSLTLIGGDTYYFYESAALPQGTITGDSTYPGHAYFTYSSGSTYSPDTSADFLVTGTPAAAPEPSGLALLGTGVLGFAGVIRRRFR